MLSPRRGRLLGGRRRERGQGATLGRHGVGHGAARPASAELTAQRRGLRLTPPQARAPAREAEDTARQSRPTPAG